MDGFVIPDNTAILKPVIPDNTAILKPVIPAQMICCPSTQNKKQSCNILIYIVIFIYVYLRYANARLHKYIRVTV
ncbi:TPA: hypothetical protein ACFN7A_002185 [Neisseria meningitidis]